MDTPDPISRLNAALQGRYAVEREIGECGFLLGCETDHDRAPPVRFDAFAGHQSCMSELFGSRQWGVHLDVVTPVWRPGVTGYQDAVVALGLRLERVDYNRGTFISTGQPIRDDVTAVVPGISFRPTPGTVFRANYRYHWTHDFVGNPTIRTAGFQLGFATYF